MAGIMADSMPVSMSIGRGPIHMSSTLPLDAVGAQGKSVPQITPRVRDIAPPSTSGDIVGPYDVPGEIMPKTLSGVWIATSKYRKMRRDLTEKDEFIQALQDEHRAELLRLIESVNQFNIRNRELTDQLDRSERVHHAKARQAEETIHHLTTRLDSAVRAAEKSKFEHEAEIDYLTRLLSERHEAEEQLGILTKELDDANLKIQVEQHRCTVSANRNKVLETEVEFFKEQHFKDKAKMQVSQSHANTNTQPIRTHAHTHTHFSLPPNLPASLPASQSLNVSVGVRHKLTQLHGLLAWLQELEKKNRDLLKVISETKGDIHKLEESVKLAARPNEILKREKDRYKGDCRRLIHLLQSTQHKRFMKELGGVKSASHYVPLADTLYMEGVISEKHAPISDRKPSAAKEYLNWVPSKSLDLVKDFVEENKLELPLQPFMVLLLQLNRVWKSKEKSKLKAKKAEIEKRYSKLQRMTDNSKPYKIVVCKERVKFLKRQLQVSLPKRTHAHTRSFSFHPSIHPSSDLVGLV